MTRVHSSAEGGASIPTEGQATGNAHRQATAAWDRAARAWSRDDGKDPEKTGALGEQMMFAAIDLVCQTENVADDLAAALTDMMRTMPPNGRTREQMDAMVAAGKALSVWRDL